MPTTVLVIAATADDGSTAANASTTFVANDVRAGSSLGTTYYPGWRFPNVQIPKNAVVTSAVFAPRGTIQTPSGSAWGSWKTAAVDNVASWSSSNTPLGIAKSATGAVAVGNSSVTSVDLTAAVQAIFSRAGWASGNALAIVIDPTGANGAWMAGDYEAGGFATQSTLTITWEAPALTALTLATTQAYDDALDGDLISTIGGSSGGNLAITADPSGKFYTLGPNLILSGTLTAGSYPISITETLDGSPNSPRTTDFTITVSAAPDFRPIGAASGTTSATIPAHRAGDWIFAYAFRDGSNTLPTIPAGWTIVNNPTGANTCSHVLVYRVATSTNTVTGTFTSATSLVVQVYRPRPGLTPSIGASAFQTGTAASATYPALAAQSPNFWGLAFGGHRSTNTALETPPTGMVLRQNVVDATDEASGFDTNGAVSSWAAQSVALGGTASGWRTVVVEIIIPLAGGQPRATFQAFIIDG